MTTDDARAIADEFQERCNQMGERHGETGRLGQCISIIRDLAARLDFATAVNLTPIDGPIPEPVNTTPPKRGKKADG